MFIFIVVFLFLSLLQIDQSLALFYDWKTLVMLTRVHLFLQLWRGSEVTLGQLVKNQSFTNLWSSNIVTYVACSVQFSQPANKIPRYQWLTTRDVTQNVVISSRTIEYKKRFSQNETAIDSRLQDNTYSKELIGCNKIYIFLKRYIFFLFKKKSLPKNPINTFFYIW